MGKEIKRDDVLKMLSSYKEGKVSAEYLVDSLDVLGVLRIPDSNMLAETREKQEPK